MSETRSDRVRRILASLIGEDPGHAEDLAHPEPAALTGGAEVGRGPARQPDAHPEDAGLLDAAARAVSARLERWGRGDALRRLFGGIGAISVPPSKIVPSVGVSNPASIRIIVVLPQPDGPNRAKNSRSYISRLKLSIATKLP